MYDYVIVHASYGHPFEHWYSWLFNELTNLGGKVLVPQFPCGNNEQSYDSWSRVMDSYRMYLDENTCYIGHSIGPAFIVDYLVNNNLKAKNLFLIAPLYDKIGIPDYDHVNSSFMRCENLEKVANLSKKRLCYISRNDPYVPNQLSESFSRMINASNIYVDNAGHFNMYAGYVKFERLLNDIKANG